MPRILDARPLGQYTGQFLQRRGRRLEGVEELGDLLHRFEEHPQVEQEGGQRPDRHVALQHPVAAVEQNHAGGDVADQLHPGHEDGQQPERLLVDLPVLVGDVFEDLLVAWLAPVGLHGLDPGHRLDELHDDQRGALPHDAVGLGRFIAEPPHQGHQDGEGGQAHQPEADIQRDEQDRRTDQGQHGGDQAVETGLQHVLDRLDVVGRPAHHPPRGVAVVEGDVEALEVPEHPAPQLQQHLLTDAAGALQKEHPADGLDQHDTAQGGDDDHQLMRRAAVDDRRNPVVDAALHQQRNRKARNVFHHHHDREEGDRRAVGPQQRTEQCARLAAPRQGLVDGQVVVLAVLNATAPAVDVGGGHRRSASEVAKRRGSPGSQAAVGRPPAPGRPGPAGRGPRRPATHSARSTPSSSSSSAASR